jgi:hypothetical protein
VNVFCSFCEHRPHRYADIISQHRAFVNLFFKNTFIYMVANYPKMRKSM